MSDVAQRLPAAGVLDRIHAERFYDWELRGRGWQLWRYAVDLEPPFRAVSFAPAPEAACFEGWEEPFANPAPPPRPLAHLPLQVTPGMRFAENPLAPAFLERHKDFLALEIASGAELRAQLTLHAPPGSPPARDVVAEALKAPPKTALFVELGLVREFFLPAPDDAIGSPACARVMRLLAALEPGELGLLQILFKATGEPWADEMLRAALGPNGTGLFGDDLVAPCRGKIGEPLHAVIVRMMCGAPRPARARAIADALSAALCRPGPANAFVALPGLGFEAQDMPARTTRRSGMILNRSELASLVPLAPAPKRGEERHGTLATRLSVFDRLGHSHVFGPDAEAATAVLLELLLHDLSERHGVVLIDPGGELVDLVLRRMPRHRLGEVSLSDPPAAKNRRAETAVADAPPLAPRLAAGHVFLWDFAASRVGWPAALASANRQLAKLHRAIAAPSRAFERPPCFVVIQDADRLAREVLDDFLAAARHYEIGVILASAEEAPRADVRIAIRCQEGQAQVRLAGTSFSLEALLAPEPADAALRAFDARQASPGRGEAPPKASALRRAFTPQEGLLRAALLARFARRDT